jgi:ATP-binding cassette subfamily F protein 3
VLECDVERMELYAELEKLEKTNTKGMDEEEKKIIYDRIGKIQLRLEAIHILTGLGFKMHELKVPSKKFSGGWRMRIAIAKVIFSEPEILLLDEPTNHLDLVALIWLEQYVKNLDITVVIVSHARDFLNQVVDEIIEF